MTVTFFNFANFKINCLFLMFFSFSKLILLSLYIPLFSKAISKNKGSYWQEILSACQCVTVLSLAEGLVDILALLHCYGSVGSKTSNAPATHLTPLQSSHAEAKQKYLKNSLGHNYCWNSQPFPNVLYDPQ